ncbi:MAG: penicillin acylase family protein [Gemmataceae bacterium]
MWLQPLKLRGFFALHHVRSFAEFRAAFEHWPVSSQHLVYADVTGTIGRQLIGQAPVRKTGSGALPLPGWRPETGWEADPVPFAQMPHQQGSPDGFLATANTRPTADGETPFLGVDFIDGYRLTAIRQALTARRDWDVASTLQLQTSQQALAWAMRDVVLTAPVKDDAGRQAVDLLAGWDGVASATSPAAAVYELFVAALLGRAMRAKAPHSWRAAAGRGAESDQPIQLRQLPPHRAPGAAAPRTAGRLVRPVVARRGRRRTGRGRRHASPPLRRRPGTLGVGHGAAVPADAPAGEYAGAGGQGALGKSSTSARSPAAATPT